MLFTGSWTGRSRGADCEKRGLTVRKKGKVVLFFEPLVQFWL